MFASYSQLMSTCTCTKAISSSNNDYVDQYASPFLVHVVEDDNKADKLRSVHGEAGGEGDLCHHFLLGFHLPAEGLEEAVGNRNNLTTDYCGDFSGQLLNFDYLHFLPK